MNVSPFNNETIIDSSFQLETNQEFNKIIQNVDEVEQSILKQRNKPVNLGEILSSTKNGSTARISKTDSISRKMKFDRSYSIDSSVIGYRTSVRSFSTTVDGSVKFFDALSINDDSMSILGDRLSKIEASKPGIVGVNTNATAFEFRSPTILEDNNDHFNGFTHDSDVSHDSGKTETKSDLSPLPSPNLATNSDNNIDDSGSYVESFMSYDKEISSSPEKKSNLASKLKKLNKSFGNLDKTNLSATISHGHSRSHSRSHSHSHSHKHSISRSSSKSILMHSHSRQPSGSTLTLKRRKSFNLLGPLKRSNSKSHKKNAQSTASREDLKSVTSRIMIDKSNKENNASGSSAKKSFFHRRSFSFTKRSKAEDSNSKREVSNDSTFFSHFNGSVGSLMSRNTGTESVVLSSASSEFLVKDYSTLCNNDTLTRNPQLLAHAIPAAKLAERNGIHVTALMDILKLCESSNNLIFAFEDIFKLRNSEIQSKYVLKKSGYTQSSEIFAEKSLKTQEVENYVQIIPFGNLKTQNQLLVSECIHALKVISKLQNCQGVINLRSSIVVKGKYSQLLLKEWDFEQILTSQREKMRPDFYSDDQLYLVMVSENSGVSLRQFKIKNWQQASRIFWNLVQILKNCELLYEFEIRDLSWDSLHVIDDGMDVKVSINEFFSSKLKMCKNSILYQNLNHLTDVFTTNDSDNDVSKLFVYSQQQMITNSKWEQKFPKTNVLWAYYVAEKLVNHKGLRPVKKPYKKVLNAIKITPQKNSESAGTKSILRKKNNNSNPVQSEEWVEYNSYESMKYILESLDPRNKTSVRTPYFKKAAKDYGKFYGEYKKKHFREKVCFEDFDSISQVFQWGELNEMIH